MEGEKWPGIEASANSITSVATNFNLYITSTGLSVICGWGHCEFRSCFVAWYYDTVSCNKNYKKVHSFVTLNSRGCDIIAQTE